MYLSQLILDPRARRVRKELANPYELHRTLLRAFPNQDEGGPGRVLYRIDQPSRAQGPELTLLVQSEKEPDWRKLDNPPGYRLPDGVNNPKAFNPIFHTGQQLFFRLRANPTKRLFCDDPKRNLKKGQRIGLLKEDDQRGWLNRQGEEGGFTILALNITNEGFVGGQTKKKHKFNHFAVRFDGVLQVTNPDQFLKTMRCGLGRGKGFGFGLLSVAPG